jgi:hypothetical protein
MTIGKTHNFVVKYDQNKVERIECFYKDVLTLVFKFKDRAGGVISLVGATATFRAALHGDTATLIEYTQADSIAVSSTGATVTLDTEDLQEGEINCQLRVTQSSVIETVQLRIKVKSLIE